MIADLLLRPDNRLLGGATGDFSLFGGQPVPGIAIGRDGGNLGYVNIAAPAIADAPVAGTSAHAAAPAAPISSIDEPTASDLGSLSPNSYFSAQPTITLPDMGGTPAIAPALAFASPTMLDLPAVTTALGSGSGSGSVGGSPPTLGLADVLPPVQTATQDALPGALAQIGGGIVAPVVDQLAVPVGGVVGAVAPIASPVVDGVVAPVLGGVAPITESVSDVVTPVVDTVADTVAPVTGTVADIATPVVDPIGDVATPVVATVAAAAAPVVDTVADVAAPVVDSVAATTTPVVDTVSDVATPVAETASNVASPVAETVATTTAPVIDAAADTVGTVAATAAPVVETTAAVTEPVADATTAASTLTQSATDTLATVAEEGFSGSDPAGGVQTLVGMVANADAFDVIAPGNDSTQDASPIIDDLASDVADAVPILGDTHDDSHSDDHGLFGDHGGLGIG